MSEMVERVAKVLWEHISECYVKTGAPALPDFDDEVKSGPYGRASVLEAARRAIAEMRDPPENEFEREVGGILQAAIEAKRIADREMLIRTLCYVLEDDPPGIPRASSYCRFVIREALESVGETV